jgi:hypothetical protein
VLEVLEVPAGKRTTITRDLSVPQSLEAKIAIDRAGGAIESLVIDRYRLRSPIEQLHTVRLRAGEHELEVDLEGAHVASATIELVPGQTYDAALLLRSAPPPVEVVGSPAWPYFAGGGGVAAAVVGSVLLAVADSSRDEIRNAEQRDGVIYGITRERAEEIESGARVKSSLGVVLVGAGAAAIGSAIAGWALD